MELFEWEGKLYRLSDEQHNVLLDLLKEDILERYNNWEYWEQDIVRDFLLDEKCPEEGEVK